MRNVAITALVFGCFVIGIARADIPPRPGDQEQLLLSTIEHANYPCGKVDSFKSAPASDTDRDAREGLNAYVVSCSSGNTYLVAVPRRRPGPPALNRDGMPVPDPDPVVKQLSP